MKKITTITKKKFEKLCAKIIADLSEEIVKEDPILAMQFITINIKFSNELLSELFKEGEQK